MKTYGDARPLFRTESEERRLLPLGNLKCRQQGQTGVRGRILEGLAMPVNSLSEDLGGFRERVAPEAMQEALEDQDSDVVALFNHRADHILGRQRAGTLTVWEDFDGLRYRARLAETGIACMVAESVRRGDLTGSSIGFIVAVDSWGWENGTKVRTIEQFKKSSSSVLRPSRAMGNRPCPCGARRRPENFPASLMLRRVNKPASINYGMAR